MTTFLVSTKNTSSLCASGLIANMKMYKYIYTCYTYTHHTWVQADGQSHLRVAFSYCWKTLSTHTDAAENFIRISSSTPKNILTKHSLVLSFMLQGCCPSLSWSRWGWIEQDGKQGWMGDETQWLDGSRWETGMIHHLSLSLSRNKGRKQLQSDMIESSIQNLLHCWKKNGVHMTPGSSDIMFDYVPCATTFMPNTFRIF